MIDRSFLTIFVTLSILSGLLYHLNSNTGLAVSMPSFVDPFTTSQSLPTSIQDEVCNDGVDNDRNGLVDENLQLDSESITKCSLKVFLIVKLILIVRYLTVKIWQENRYQKRDMQ